MPAFRQHLSDRIVGAGAALTLTVAVEGGEDGVGFGWQHDNIPVAGATASAYQLPAVAAGDAGVWTVTATRDGASASSSATVVVVDTATAVEPPYAWVSGFARAVAIVVGTAAVVAVAPLWVRGWFLVTDPPGRADAGLVAALVAVVGTGLLAAAAYAVLVEVRGRARADDRAGIVGGADVAQVIDSLGKVRTVHLLAIAGLLALGFAGLLGWQLTDAPTAAVPVVSTPTPTPSATAVPGP